MGSSSIQTLGWTGRGVWHLDDFYNIHKVNKNNNLNEHSCAELKQKDSQRREMNVQESRKSKWHHEEKQNKGFQHTNNPQQLRRTKGKLCRPDDRIVKQPDGADTPFGLGHTLMENLVAI
jgi:hypothetical protein